MTGTWTLTELVERAEQALRAGDVHATNARITAMPDARVIRWYSTIGLVDRPCGMRGRTALYHERHLLQLVAIKRRQSQGRALAHIQAELANATDDYLRQVAAIGETTAGDISAGGAAAGGPTAGDAARKPATRPAPPPSPETGRSRFWAEPAPRRAGVRPGETTPRAATPTPGPIPVPESRSVLTGVPLRDGVQLLLPFPPRDDDLAAIIDAAQPLLDLLAVRGLTTPHHTGRNNR